MNNTLYSQLPAVDRLLQQDDVQPFVTQYGQTLIVMLLRDLQQQARTSITQQQCLPSWCDNWAKALQNALDKTQQSALKRVINLTGTVLHTNLGRALMPQQAVEAVSKVMSVPVTLEYDLDGAERGHRDRQVADLLCQLTGAEDACIVNNNAAAVLLMLAAVADGKEVVVSRGELVEIGGAFRIPDVMRQAGAILHEVGTTNRTHEKDYHAAVNANTALLMKVHASNYHIEGFTSSVSELQLVEIGKAHHIATASDLGSGALIDMSQYGLPKEPMPQELIAAGMDLVSFSGDKLLGGPQAGIIVGKKALIEKIQRHPLKRALRCDKMTLAALDATLRLYLSPEKLQQHLPTLRLLSRDIKHIENSAKNVLAPLISRYGNEFDVIIEPCQSQIGSGSLPVNRLDSWAITFSAKSGKGSALDKLAQQWRNIETPVIGRINDGKLWLDMRCLEDENLFIEALSL